MLNPPLTSISILFFLIIAPPAVADGKSVYDSSCLACHTTGVAGSPKLGDKEAWAQRIEKGVDKLVENAIKGFKGDTGFMPAKGGNARLSDDEVRQAVEYIVQSLK